MSFLDFSPIGNLSGKIGGYNARTVNNKTIFSVRPAYVKISNSPASVKLRSKFSVTAALSKSIFDLPDLKAIWQSVKNPKIITYNTIFKYNFLRSTADKPTINNIITPNGFNLPVTNASVNKSNITVSVSALNSASIFTPPEVTLSAISLVCFTDPPNPESAKYKIIACSKEFTNYNFNEARVLEIDFNSEHIIISDNYSRYILLLCVAAKTTDDKITQYSATFGNEGTL